ncbi:polysaccharide deacetylase family protein [Nitrososphaera viennensis]|uniref:Polysaccharide deacetylase family protein n=2 Tax=Nitrososphaera viennensis TaxID=1034015 RepID=A0A977ID37_9ARCH|nr:polysaccharide deacetylase family protein [Nitrososphaera viennensis]AIC16652.1 putative exported polysaccharide deacetylase family protein [Nitrososphaera viennensis EN76]UVS68576.1 polysaccharide deacetylase family protein [Nitrososphaera viennensis]
MIATGAVIVIGVAMIVPAFTQHQGIDNRGMVMLSFDISHAGDKAASWCKDLASTLAAHKVVKATVFVTGEIAEKSPECVTSFSSNTGFDVGSQAYSYVDLVSLNNNYTRTLEEVQKGKESVDNAGNLNSRLFKAPYGKTDENIYSLLTQAGIVADFSYVNHYNKYEGGQFIKYDLKVLPGTEDGFELFTIVSNDANFVPAYPQEPVPLEITFDNSMEIKEIDKFLSELGTSPYNSKIRFVSASDIAGLDLTAERRLQ